MVFYRPPIPVEEAERQARDKREKDRKPSTPPRNAQAAHLLPGQSALPLQPHRNSGLFKVAQLQRPEDLDALAAQLNELAAAGNGNHDGRKNGGPPPRKQENFAPKVNGSSGQGRSRQQEHSQAPPPPPDDSDSSSDEDVDDGVVRNDGTMLASDPPRPL